LQKGGDWQSVDGRLLILMRSASSSIWNIFSEFCSAGTSWELLEIAFVWIKKGKSKKRDDFELI
jgi:hypothetical protein